MTTGKTDTTQRQTVSTLRRACSEYLTEIDGLKAEIERQKQLIYALECTMSRMDERDSR